MYYLATGNRAMKDTLIWSLPAIQTCPMSTRLCKQYCYAYSAERRWPNTTLSRNRNLKLSKKRSFVDDMVTIITAYELMGSYKHFRIHESGDFYSQRYLDCWKAICSYFPDIKFVAFTKSYHLNYEVRPNNLQIIMSAWEDSDFSKLPSGFPIYFTGMKGWNSVPCVGGHDKCNSCGFKCWDLSKIGTNVWINIH